MRKIFFVALTGAILSLSASSLFARGMGGGGCGEPGMGRGMHKPFQHLEMLQYMLDLTNAQVDKMYKIDKEYMEKFHQNRNDADKIRELREKHQAEIESILTTEQKVKWNEFKEDRPMKDRDKGMKDGKGPGFGPMDGMAGPGTGMMQKYLGLSDEQVEKIYKIQRDYMDNFYKNRNDGDKVRELRTKQDAEIDNVLTPEQKTKRDEFRKNHPMRDNKPKDGKGHHRMMDDDEKE